MKRSILLIVFFLIFKVASATHLMGADISYQYVSAMTYKITAKVYRDCRGVPLNSPVLQIMCPNGQNIKSLAYTRIAINDISNKCKYDTIACVPTNTPTNFGIEEHIYVATVDFSQSPYDIYKNSGCCEVKISIEQCCRNGAITTLSPGNFYSEAMLNVCQSEKNKNSSPIFNSYPVQYVCCNSTLSFSQGINNDINQDSVSFELVAPLNANNSNETYTGSFTPQKPMTVPNNSLGFRFDSETGGFIITPINCTEVGVIVVQVSEWRKDSIGVMRKIGYTRREMELIVKTCGYNNDPYFTGAGKYTVCEGNKLCFTIGAKDDPFLPKQTALDTVSIRLINKFPGISFKIQDTTAREKSVDVCWQTKPGDAKASPYLLTIEARDNYCPDPRIAFKDISILVKPTPSAKRVYTRLFKGRLEMASVPLDSQFSQYTYQFLVMDSMGGFNSAGQFFKRVDTFQFTLPGKYYIQHTINKNNCPRTYIDTIIITPQHITTVPATDIITFNVSPNPGQGIFTLQSNWLVEQLYEAHIFSIDGKRVGHVPVVNNQINLSALSDGIYTIDIQTIKGVLRTQVIIKH